MPSILSSCLILLKLAMAVNDGLHSMLSNVYSVIESVMQSDHNRQRDMESIQESSSAPAFQRSKSQILEAFNRRRTNLANYEQTDVLVSNLTPFQEITITNKDVEGRRKLTVSPIKPSRKRTVTRSNKDVESNGETSFPEKSPSLTNSHSLSSSLVSSETPNESEDRSSVKEANIDLSRDDSMDESIDYLEEDAGTHTNFPTQLNISASSTSRDFRSSTNKSPTNLSCLKSLQAQIHLLNKRFLRPSASSSNANNPSLKNAWGLTDSDSTNGENVSREINSKSAIISPEDAVARKEFLADTTKLSEQFLRNYYARKDACTNLKTPKTSPGTKDSFSSSSSDSNKSHQTFEDNFTPMGIVSSNSPLQATSSDEPSTNIYSSEQKTKALTSIKFKDSSNSTDSMCTGFENFSDAKPLSRVSATKRIDTAKVPLMLKKDSWINMDDVDFIKPESSQKLRVTSAWNNESNLAVHSKECSLDFDNQIQPKDELSPFGTGEDAFEVSQNCQATITPNISCSSPSVCEELDDSDDLEELSLERVDALTKVLQDVGATEILDESNASKKDIFDLLNEISDATQNIIGAAEKKSASLSNKKIPYFDNVPLTDLDTEEKQINYLNNVTESCLNEIKNGNESKQKTRFMMDDLIDDFEQRYKVVLDSITNAYKNELDSLTQSAGMSLDPLIDTGLKTKYSIPLIEVEGTSNEGNCNTRISPQQKSAPRELDAFGLPFFVQNESKVQITEHVLNENESFEIKSETANDLLDVDKDHSENSFSIDTSRQNETSTPIRDEMLENQNWVFVNLSSDSRKEFEVTNDDAKPCIAIETCQNSTFTTKDVILSVINNGMEGEVVWSPNTKRVKCGSTLEAKDWVDLEAEMSKNYLKCISILNMCDDEVEVSNMKKESNCNASDMGKSDGEAETLCKRKEDLVENGNCNEAHPLVSDGTCLDIAKDSTNAKDTRNLDSFEKQESEIVLEEQNVTCSASSTKDIADSAELKSEELSSKNNELHALRSSDNNALNCGVSIMGNSYLDSEDGNNKDEVQIADRKELEILSKPENASGPKNVSQNVSSGAVNSEEFLSSTNRIFVQRPLNELQIKTSPCKKNILNEEFLLNDYNKEVKCYLKYVERKDKNIMTAREVDLFHPSTEFSNRELNFGYQRPTTCRISKQSLKDTCSSIIRKPISHIRALQQREESETTRMYDNKGIYLSKPLITIHSDRKSNLNAGFKYEAGIQTSQNANENKLACNDEINNTQIPENSLTIASDAGSIEAFVTKCENRGKADFDSEILN